MCPDPESRVCADGAGSDGVALEWDPRTGVLMKKGNLDIDRQRKDGHQQTDTEGSWRPRMQRCRHGPRHPRQPEAGRGSTGCPLGPGRERAPARTQMAGFWLLGGENRRAVVSGPGFVALCRSPGKPTHQPFWDAVSTGL